MPSSSTFSVGGLASGLDTNSIIDQLVKLESSSVTKAQSRQSAYQSQISQLGSLSSALGTLSTAAKNLKTSGALGITQTGIISGLTATPSSSAIAGRYQFTVDSLATAAKSRSAAFTSASDLVTAGTLTLSINGTSTDVALTEGMTLAQAAKAINESGAMATATVLESNGTAFLSITNKNTGFTVGGQPADALTITETSSGSTGQALGLSSVITASNARVTVDGLTFERTANVVDDAIAGVSLALTQTTTTPQDLVLGANTSATQKNLESFVSAYNGVMRILRENLNIGQLTDRTKTLGGDSAVRALQSQLMSVVSSIANPSSAVRTLADLGIKSQSDGTLTIDSARLSKAIATDASAVNSLFQRATEGVTDRFTSLVETYTNSTNGILVSKSKSFESSVKQLDKQIESLQLRVSSYRTKLVSQFTAMEKVVSSFKSIGNFLTSQSNQNSKSE